MNEIPYIDDTGAQPEAQPGAQPAVQSEVQPAVRPEAQPETQPEVQSAHSENEALLQEINSGIKNLNDLFVRRLFEDKQKNELVNTLSDLATYAVLEPFVYDLILLLDRIDRVEGDFAESVAEEILEMLSRRDVHKIKATREFNPECNKVVKVIEDPKRVNAEVTAIVRNGYSFGEKIIRPVEVVLAKPTSSVPDCAAQDEFPDG